MKTSSEVREWYNAFSTKQVKTGINLRHYHIFRLLVRSGLQRHHSVLEIGCGIGALTRLLSNYVTKGHIAATDISDVSIDIARKALKGNERIQFYVTDMNDFSLPEKFDFVVLPDVLEHIPMDQHDSLFRGLAQMMHPEAKLAIHLPRPKLIEYLNAKETDKLQVIDQAVYADFMLKQTYRNGLFLESYNMYSLFHQEPDYAFIVFTPGKRQEFSHRSKMSIIFKKLFARLAYTFRTGRW